MTPGRRRNAVLITKMAPKRCFSRRLISKMAFSHRQMTPALEPASQWSTNCALSGAPFAPSAERRVTLGIALAAVPELSSNDAGGETPPPSPVPGNASGADGAWSA
uniref:Uncharacterized protein n=1 Tax=Vitis vinifera TaxID=29760 RepID=A5BR15_VITVI|nr:hypothetical protein VITISV_040597 [Vitis vinifera]